MARLYIFALLAALAYAALACDYYNYFNEKTDEFQDRFEDSGVGQPVFLLTIVRRAAYF